jgi:tetratricopeptide (TPR) repeat protein
VNYSRPNILLPILKVLLARGFDASGTHQGISSLHIALWNGHDECAVELARAGVAVSELQPTELNDTSDGRPKTALEVAEQLYPGSDLAERLQDAATTASIVSDTIKRRDLLRLDKGKGAAKLAKRAMEAGNSMLKTARWKEAEGLLIQALSYNDTGQSFSSKNQFVCKLNLSTCQLQTGRWALAEETARNLLIEFPSVPLAMVQLGIVISHPGRGSISAERWNKVENLAHSAEVLMKTPPPPRSSLRELYDLEPRDEFNRRVRSLLVHAEKSRKMLSPVLQAAQTALDELYSYGDYEKAAYAIDVALQPALKHPNPLSMRFNKGNINFEWAARMLQQANDSLYGENDIISTIDSYGDDSNAISDGINSVKLQPGWDLAETKFTIALEEFTFCRHNNDERLPWFLIEWNMALSLIALGRMEEASKVALSSIKQ